MWPNDGEGVLALRQGSGSERGPYGAEGLSSRAEGLISDDQFARKSGFIDAEIQKFQKDGFLAYQFVISEGGKNINVLYQGIVPDTFKDGAQVVATGSLKEDGSFVASELLAKCASKYEAKLKQ